MLTETAITPIKYTPELPASFNFPEPDFEWVYKATRLQDAEANPVTHATAPRFLDERECRALIASHSLLPSQHANVEWGTRGSNRRSTDVFWISPNQENEWLFDRLTEFIRIINQKYFKFELYGYLRAFQLGRYKQNQGYDWHQDMGPGATAKRKLTVSIQLSNPDNYTGGELQLFGADKDHEILPNAQGSISIFPSWALHRVNSVSSGERWSLVAWIEGPPFR